MFTYLADDALGVDRNALEVEAIDDVKLLALALSSGTYAIFNPQELCSEDRLYYILSQQPVNGAFQVRFHRELIMPRGDQPLDLDEPMIHALSVLTVRDDANT